MKKVIVVTSSPRKNGNSETLANSFAEGAKAAGNEVLQVARQVRARRRYERALFEV